MSGPYAEGPLAAPTYDQAVTVVGDGTVTITRADGRDERVGKLRAPWTVTLSTDAPQPWSPEGPTTATMTALRLQSAPESLRSPETTKQPAPPAR